MVVEVLLTFWHVRSISVVMIHRLKKTFINVVDPDHPPDCTGALAPLIVGFWGLLYLRVKRRDTFQACGKTMSPAQDA